MTVPLFALADASIAIDGDFLERAADSPITLGVLVGYAAGKPLGVVGTAWLSRATATDGRLGRRRRRRR